MDLARALEAIPRRTNPNVLVGTETADDAAVYRLNDEQALVETVDFFSPIVDDPYHFGRVAAANALSDIYAMGGSPIFALNIVAFPLAELGHEVLSLVLQGGDAKAQEAGIPILGGHSVRDAEPKYGMVVTGLVHPDRLIRNTGAHPGDVLFLTKPLGSGVLTTALKKGRLDETVADEIIEIMATLNKGGGEAMAEVGVHAATDVTGFGLLGHLSEMVRGTDVGVTVHGGEVPFLPGVLDFVAEGICPGGSRKNLEHFGQWVDVGESVGATVTLALADAQTSGGLLIACPADRADDLEAGLTARGTLAAARIGEFHASGAGRVRLSA